MLGFEPKMSKCFYQDLQPGMTVLDIGAHDGYYSVLASSSEYVGVMDGDRHQPDAIYQLLNIRAFVEGGMMMDTLCRLDSTSFSPLDKRAVVNFLIPRKVPNGPAT